ncbi:uncharacterized protein [Watersipora subatra]|uniref:uncharacterized protein n=1 Tax=Watersipora subatra TaxID=2589382 RepID=UPI00355AFC9E
MMLQLKTFYPDAFLVPCYDTDLAWHTHQLHPHLYKQDTVAYLGKMFNHDDNMTDRSADSYFSQSEAATKKMWQDTYEVPMTFNGAMYRGVSPVGKLKELTIEQNQMAADQHFQLKLTDIEADNKHSEKMKMVLSLGRMTLVQKKDKRGRGNTFTFGQYQSKISLFDDYGKTLTLSFTQKEEGCCMSSDDIGHISIDFKDYLVRNRSTKQNILISKALRDSSITVKGEVSEARNGSIRLTLKAGAFSNVVMPETVEEMWGPVPLRRLPPGVVNHCTVANHALSVHGTGADLFTARVIHSQPLLMSCVQIYFRDRMVAISHLVGTEQLPEDDNMIIKSPQTVVTLRRREGERAMLVKTSQGDKAIIFGHWANMVKGVPGTWYRRCVRGNPGNLKVRISNRDNKGVWRNQPSHNIFGNSLTVGDMKVDLTGKVEIGHAADVGEKLCIAFSIAVLTCLCQPPPPGLAPPVNANQLGVQPPPPRYRHIFRGTRAVAYNDGASLAFVAAAGWMMASPSNYYLHHHYIHSGLHAAGCAGACAGDGRDGGGGCGGCGGCGDGGGLGGRGGCDGGGGGGGGCGGGGCG